MSFIFSGESKFRPLDSAGCEGRKKTSGMNSVEYINTTSLPLPPSLWHLVHPGIRSACFDPTPRHQSEGFKRALVWLDHSYHTVTNVCKTSMIFKA